MKKLFILFYSVASLSNAQSDSLAVIQAHWKTEKIAKGVQWKSYLFENNLFGSNQSINILEIKKNRKTVFAFGYDTKVLRHTSEFGKASGAMAALNGTFFDMKNGGSNDFLKIEGQVIHQNKMQDKRNFHQKAAICLDRHKLEIQKWNGTPDWESTLTAKNIMASGPLLILSNQYEAIDSSAFSYTRHPRTAIVVTKDKRILLITVDGRSEHAAGMTLYELAKLLKWLNAKDGINLDGGGSTTLWIHNQPGNGVVNYPSDNKVWDHEGERKVANVVLVKKRR
ncbi:MAG: phosphodiester glycosidase family protein [Cyclobacteriaceae bacterium]